MRQSAIGFLFRYFFIFYYMRRKNTILKIMHFIKLCY
nr:MAG TPA: hypothetical protein [Caudoviricetes sp.]